MQLTFFSDYAVRTVLYLAMHDDRVVRVEEISSAYGISRHHVIKVVQLLVGAGVVRSERGRGGGLRLALPADQVNVGWLIRLTEPTLNLAECFDKATNTCPIVPSCGLRGALQRANDAFYGELDKHTLADFLPNRERLLPLWRKELRVNGWPGDGNDAR